MNRTLGILALILGLAPGSGSAATPGGTAELWLGVWEAESWGLDDRGSFCLASAAEGNRWEILRAGPGQGGWADLWSQSGQGWTVVQAASGDGTWNAWGREWTSLDPVIGRFLTLLAVTAGEWSGSGGTRTTAVPEVDPAEPGAFRTRLVRRGLGQGEGGEMVTFSRTVDGPDDPLLIIRSSRRPGSLRLRTSARDVLPGGLPPEIFAPLWTLADFLEVPADFSGTGRP